MEKIFLIVLALVMMASIALTGAGAETDPKGLFEGTWICGRARAEMVWEEEGFKVLIVWGSSAWEHTEWEYSCYFHEDDLTLVSMPFGIRTDYVFNEQGEPVSADEIYNDGEATFALDGEGCLLWLDEKENAGDGMRFERAEAVEKEAVAFFGKTVEPEGTETERLAGATVHATIGAYNEEDGTFTVILYKEDRYDGDDAERLQAGDILLAGGRRLTVQKKGSLDGLILITSDNGEEILFVPAADDDDELIAQSTDDDRIYMHAFCILHLPPAADILLEDWSDPERNGPEILHGLEEILRFKAETEENSNGLSCYATTVTLNGGLEIESIRRVYDVAQ